MSQAGMVNFGSQIVIPGDVPTSFVTDSGTVIPSSNVVNINGGYTNLNNVNGIRVIANPNNSQNEVIQLTNRFQVAASFTDNVNHVLYSQNLGAVSAGYFIHFDLVALNKTNPGMAVASIGSALFTNGTTSMQLNQQDVYLSSNNTMVNLTVTSGANGPSNLFFVSVTGYNNTDTIDYNLTGYYVVVS